MTAQEILSAPFASHVIENWKPPRTGGPFIPISASAHTDDWPCWMVVDVNDRRRNLLGSFSGHVLTDVVGAVEVAVVWNAQKGHIK